LRLDHPGLDIRQISGRSTVALPLDDYILYELHVGTYTPEGTFEAVIPHLDGLARLGVTAVELMPVAQFPGARNWGYDGVDLFAVQNSYGGPEGLRRLVDACHAKGLAVVLDVVYNHLGPEGNYLGDFAPYFDDRYRTPWGPALNFEGPFSDDVRRFFVENALYWIEAFHLDALRLDAVHAILDTSAVPFLEELGEAVHARARELGRRVYLMPESNQNDPRLVLPRERGGMGLDAVWTDDFHHVLHVLLTGERSGYYRDFEGVGDLARSFREGFVYTGRWSPFRRRRHGRPAGGVRAGQHVVFAQNHDQVGNRMRGERLGGLVPFEKQKLAAGVTLLSPFLPLIFMGEEYGETAPFQYFVSHSDPGLIRAVRRGRREEFASFGWEGRVPDPQSEATFRRSRLRHRLKERGRHRTLYEFHRALIELRRSHPALVRLDKKAVEAAPSEGQGALWVRRRAEGEEALAVFHFGDSEAAVSLPPSPNALRKRFDSAERKWGGPGSRLPETLGPGERAELVFLGPGFAIFTNE